MAHSKQNYTQDTKNIWFPSQREPLYDPTNPNLHQAFKEYWKREKDRMVNGFYLADGQVFISGWLYFHTVYWKIAMYIEDPNTGRKPRVIGTPFLRDIEWDIGGDFIDCEEQGKFYNLVGSRDFGKSIIAASRAGYQYTLFDNSEAVISGGAANYIKLATDKIEDGLTNLHPVLQKKRLTSDWKKEIRAGWKEKSSGLADPKSSNSRILVRNYQDGTKTMAANGTRPGFHLIDEEGTIPNLIGCIKDSDGCWWSGGGTKPSCLVMLAGTGGDMDKGKEAADVFTSPDAFNILSFENIWEPGQGRIGRFVPATKAKMAFKYPMPLSQYLGIEHPDLDKITILVSDEVGALMEWWEPEYKKALSSGNSKVVLKFKAYWPLKPSDSFIILTKNNYNVEAAKAQQQRLKQVPRTGVSVKLFHDGEKICHEFLDIPPISQFPIKDQTPDAPIQIYEFPDTSPPFGLYVAGVDSYRMGKAEFSDSLGAVYILKRQHNIIGETYQNMIVASYVARPESHKTWNEQARLLIKLYNARTLVENDEPGFIEYMKAQGDSHYLEPQPDWIKEISPNTTARREFGVHRSSERIRNFLHGAVQRYLDEVIERRTDDSGSVISETLGVHRIPDTMLLEEIIRFNEDDNFDREIAFSLACAMAEALDGKIGKPSSKDVDPRLIAYYARRKSNVTMNILGGDTRPVFFGAKKRKSNLFR